jgi:hypothetical protein
VREAHREARRVDARLGREADEAAEQLVTGARRDDEHRVFEVADEGMERLRHIHAAGPTPRVRARRVEV